MLLLILSTNFLHLLKALEKLKAPAVFIMIVSFMYRYVFILQDEFMHMKQAKESRTVGGSRWFHVKTLANMAGVLFIRSYERAEEVYLAMLARGFDGKIKTIYDFKIKAKDVYFLLAAAGIFTLIGISGV
jgi:cobalt/nickel transport system permease protein